MILKAIPFLIIFMSQLAFAQAENQNCGSLANAFGPYDYRTERGQPLNLVEGAHFTPQVEALIKGNAGYLGGDLDYTLRAFPNHHRALMAAMRFGERTKSPQPPNMRYSVECYFARAIRFKPDDAIVRMIFSMYLAKHNRVPEAIQQLDIASTSKETQDNPFTHYNLGLNYFELKEFDKALDQAHIAYSMGFPQTTLKEELSNIGKWTEPKAKADLPAIGASGAEMSK